MAVTDAQVEALLETLKALLDQIEPLRAEYARLTTALKPVRQDYDEALRLPNLEADRLEGVRHALEARFQRRKPPPPQPPLPPLPPITPPKPTEGPGPAPVPAASPRLERKRRLADHIFLFTNQFSDQSALTEQLNAVLVDEGRDVGDMLELIPWDQAGVLWRARSDWETLEEQFERLHGWHGLLTDRLTFWQAERRRLEDDHYYPWLLLRQSCSDADWRGALRAEADKLAQENAAAAAKLAAWEAELAAREVGG